jgi:hypothetical protein
MRVKSLVPALLMMAAVVSSLGCLCLAGERIPQIPISVRTCLSSAYPDWRVLQLSDLDQDIQQFWHSEHPNEHPGFISGSFTGPNQKEWVVNLARTKGVECWQRLVLLKQDGKGSFSRIDVLEPEKVQVFVVLLKNPPGSYRSSDRQFNIKVKNDAFSLAIVWGGVRLFYWAGGSFKSFNTAE